MTSFTEKAHKACEWPEVVVRDSIVSPELGIQADPIVIRVDLAPLGSASNPIVIHVDEEIMATPEFWETLIDDNFTVPAGEDEVISSSSARAPSRSPVFEDLEDLHSFGQSSTNRFHLDDKALKMTVSSFDVLQNCTGREAPTRESVANGPAESEQSTGRGKVSQAEEPSDVSSVFEPSSV
ncbi:uncharacterized protein N7496_010271 [Penicillium cataractarum]|uniref:Uncharacterized protein n=1 Tax=Penicillium cataractarum TaxID=2100454 RepID=A0A9W9RVE6_9EURO|nr:uncharacterized protein N7496_010271 [Penicillium cataractarum]KAJ5364558.1 hypothetical protein N7496_010271 [Penicillium cataractarum]